MDVSEKNVYAEFLMQRSLELCLGCMPCSAPSNPPLIKWREAYWGFFSVLVFLLPPPPVRKLFCRHPC